MKKTLLLTALAVAVSVQSFAQEKSARLNADMKAMKAEYMKAGVAPVKAIDRNEKATKGVSAIKPVRRKVMADEVWYQRPVGTMYVSGDGYIYPLIPPFLTTTWANKATAKENAMWSFKTETASYPIHDFDGKDLEMDFPKIETGYISRLYIPHLSVGDVDYKLGAEFENVPNQDAPDVALINGDSVISISQVNMHGGYFTGFSNGYVFGTDKRTFEDEEGNEFEAKTDAIYEIFQKPISPLYISSINFLAVSESANMIPEGKEMKLAFHKIEDGAIGELIEEMSFTMKDTVWFDKNPKYDGKEEIFQTFALFEVKKTEKDAFGTEFEVPVIIDEAFAVVISGFEQEGVDFSLYMCDVMATEGDYYENDKFILPTMRSFVRVDNGEPIEGLRPCQYINSADNERYNAEDKEADPEHYKYYDWRRQYNAVILLNAMYDVAKVIADEDYNVDYKNMKAPVEGGRIFTEYEITEEDDDGNEVTENYRDDYVLFYSSLPYISTWEGLEGEANYDVTELPDWLEVEGFSQEAYYAENPEEESDDNILILVMKAQPLPDGVEGRKATFNIVSERGAKSETITVTQGVVESQGIVTIGNHAPVMHKGKTYNLNGQRISGSYNGIVVCDGKKVIRK